MVLRFHKSPFFGGKSRTKAQISLDKPRHSCDERATTVFKQRRQNMVNPDHNKLRTNPQEIADLLLDELTKTVPFLGSLDLRDHS